MKRIIQFTLFFSIFSAIVIMLHYYVFSSLFDLFGIPKKLNLYLLILIFSFIFPVSMVVERKCPNGFSRVFYTLSATWMGIIFLLFSFVLIYDIISIFLNIQNHYTGMTIVFLTILTTVYGLINNYFIKIRKISLFIDGKELGKNLKIALFSDLHLGTVNREDFLSKIIKKTNTLKPDAIMITGDLVDGSAPLSLNMLKPLDRLKAPIFFVIGNHEIYDDLNFVLPILNKTKIKIIRNSVIDWNGIQIAGIEFYEGYKKPAEAIDKLKIDRNKYSILLNHAPVGFEKAAEKGIDLMLSGHTHNGQIFPFSLLTRLFYKYVTGLHKLENSFLYVSQGTGTWGPPMRVFTNSEIVLLILKRKKI